MSTLHKDHRDVLIAPVVLHTGVSSLESARRRIRSATASRRRPRGS